MNPIPSTPGWIIGRSIAIELDVALTAAGGSSLLGDQQAGLFQRLPADWLAEWPLLLGEPFGINSIFSTAAGLTGVLIDEDYSRVSLAIREQSLAELMARWEIDPGDDPAAAFTRWGEDWVSARYRLMGLPAGPDAPAVRQARLEIARIPRLLRGGDLHGRFWHWLDRFYYEFYRPWRQDHLDKLEALELHARAALGGVSSNQPPALDWLPVQHPLLRMKELGEAVQAGQIGVFFWVDPFNLVDLWGLTPDRVMVSFSEPDESFMHFRERAVDVAGRAQALADPTRLTILRMIRQFGMLNTDIAAYLGISRPTVSVHARILRDAGLIRSRQVGREVRHELADDEVRRLFRDLETFLDLPPEDKPDGR